jgi:pyruvate/2-oxoacid:ferredoxin oxidoreductase beta subunit/Pyruvate/2-oxoacid:ferredoxin oxidoreductase gamma subunit
MSGTVTVTGLGSYRNERPYPFCPGCGHGPILDALDGAFTRRAVDPAKVVIVSDIGCSGLSDQYFATSAFHGLHGRSITYATGIKLARPELEVVVVMGDGGTGIGGAHLINASRRNVGITVLVMNNLNFGMTGGQHSTTTPAGAVTPTTPDGNLERPLDICGTAAVNGAAYAYRGTSFDDDLADRLAEAMAHPGFAILDIWELCTAYFVRRNRFSRRAIQETLDELDFATGVLAGRDVAEYAAAYRAAHAGAAPLPRPAGITPSFSSSLSAPASLLLAGAAGGRVGSAARTTGQAAITSGLWATLRSDYPVTVKTGHSVATLTVGPDPIEAAVSPEPDAVAVLAPEGLGKVRGLLSRLPASATVLALPDLDVETPATVLRLDPARADERIPRTDLALAAAAALTSLLDLMPLAALAETADEGSQQVVRAAPGLVVAS